MTAEIVVSAVVLAVLIGVGVALVGLVILGCLVERSRRKAETRLDTMQARILQLAVNLSEQTQAEGHEARIRLIRAANLAMSEQRGSSRSF